MSATKRYESTYVLNATLADDVVAATTKKFEDTVTKNGGSVIESEAWGIRRLAYPIRKQTNGRYISLHFTCEGSVIGKLERAYQLEEEMLRWLTLEMSDEDHQGRAAMKTRVDTLDARRAAGAKAQADAINAEPIATATSVVAE